MKFYKSFWLFLIAPFFLSNCHIPESSLERVEEGEVPTNSSFYVNKSSGKFIESFAFENIDLPRAKQLSFQACVKNKKTNKEIPRQDFLIKTEDGFIDAKTDDSGCLNWLETREFPVLKEGRRIMIKRLIVNKGRFRGSVEFSYIINPWTGLVLTENDTQLNQKGIDSLSLAQVKETPNIARLKVVPQRSLFTIERIEGDQARYKLDFIGQFVLESRDNFGQKIELPIRQAKFQTRVTILNQRKDGSYHLVHREKDFSTPTRLHDGNLIIETAYLSNTSYCPNGRTEVALEINLDPSLPPGVTDGGIPPFQMIYKGPSCQASGLLIMLPNATFQSKVNAFDWTSLLKTPQLRDDLSPLGLFFREEKIVLDAPPKILLNTSRNFLPDQGGNVTYIQPLLPKVTSNFGTQFSKIKKVQFSTCLVSSVDTDLFRRTELEIKTITKSKPEIKLTDDKGCFAWEEDFKYNYFQPQCWKVGEVEIKEVNDSLSKGTSIHHKLKIGYNEVSHSDMFFDMRYYNISEAETCEERKHLKSSILLTQFTLQKVTHEFDVDKYLNLLTNARGVIQINPSLTRPSLSEAVGHEDEFLPRGKYRLKMAIVDLDQLDLSQLDGSKIYAYDDKIVELNDRTLIAENYSFQINDLFSLGNANTLYISLAPIEDSLGENFLETRIFSGRILVNDINIEAKLQPIKDQVALETIEKAYTNYRNNLKLALEKSSNKSDYSKENGLKLINFNSDEDIYLRTALTQPLIEFPLALSQKDFTPEYSQEILPFDKSQLLNLIKNPTNFQSVAKDFCHYWFGDWAVRNLPDKNVSFYSKDKINLKRLIHKCISTANENPYEIFEVSARTFVKNPSAVKKNLERTSYAGQFRDVQIGQNFSQNRQTSRTYTESLGWDFGLGARLDFPQFKALNANSGLKVVYQRAYSEAETQNTYESISAGIALRTEVLDLTVKAEKVEQCVSIRLNSSLFKSDKTPPLFGFFRPIFFGERSSKWFDAISNELTLDEKVFYSKSGLLLCDGEGSEKPAYLNETYALFNQNIYRGQILSETDKRNRPFFTSVRGENDYLKLLGFLTSALKIPPGFEGDFKRAGLRDKDMKGLFQKSSPGYPGVTEALPKFEEELQEK